MDSILTLVGMAMGAYAGAQVVQLGQAAGRAVAARPTTEGEGEDPSLRYTMFDVKTRALSSSSEMFGPLTIFHEKLRYDIEFDRFKRVIQYLDVVMFLEGSMHGSKATLYPKIVVDAEKARSAAIAQLNEIVKFGDVVIPSETRREGLTKSVTSVTELTDTILLSMQSIMAAVH